MAFENGSGSGGGNGSVWFEVRHGSDARPQTLQPAGLDSPLAPSASSRKRAAAPATATRKQSAGARKATAHQRPGAGQVKLDNDGKCACVSIHDQTVFDHLGADDHKGMFRVRLRIRKETMEQLIKGETNRARRAELKKYWAALPQIAKTLQKFTGDVPHGPGETWEDTTGDVFVIVDVPAVPRKPVNGKPWPYMPWEIYWQW
jgi:hypothetical protein